MSEPRQTPDQSCDEAPAGASVNASVREDQASTIDLLLARLDAAVLFLDRGWRVTYLNPQSDPFLIDMRKALLGKTFREAFPGVSDSPVFRSFHEALTASVALHREAYHPSLHKWFEIHLLPLPEGWAVSVQEVTRRKQEEAIIASLAAIVASSDDAIFGKTLDGIILTWNGGAERLYGYEAREIIGQSVYRLVPPDRRQEWYSLMERLQAGERVDHLETVRVRKDGSLVEVSITISPVMDAAGHLIGASAIARNITGRNAMEHRLRRSERRFRALTEQSADAVIEVDIQGIIQYASPSSRHVLGYEPEALLGRNAFELVHPADREHLMTVFGRVLASGKVQHVEYRARHQDGTYRWLEASGVNLLDEPDIQAVVGNYRDITERKLLQERIWQSEQQLQAIVDGSPACIYVKDAHGHYLRVNQQVLDLNHLTREQMLGKTDEELFPHKVAGPLQAHDRAVLESGRAETREVVGRLPDGQRTFLSVKFPLCGADGIPYAVCGISTDITERVVLEQRKDDLISMVSHELKTPLTSLLAYTELLHRLLSQQGHQQAVHYLARMDAQLNRLNRLIVELLDMARAQAGQLAFAEELVGIGDLVLNVVEHFQPTAPRHCIQVVGQADCEVIGDRDRLEQVIFNLLSNAVKYSPGAEIVMVGIEETADEVTVSVQDFGIGIAVHQQERVFERFYRVLPAQEQRFPGLGIGLYLSREIIAHHGGRIWVESVEGQGSTFCFALPRKER